MDRIYEAYIGEMGKEFQEKTRKRLHWICEQVRGSSVLDVGCSQGIGSLLLGRNGFFVTGLDVTPEAIAFADGLLEQEPAPVRSRVQFLCQDFFDFDAGECHFDTVIFGEVLEHLIRPDLFMEKAWALLNDGGRIIITVPFGINDDPDHKQTFYYSKLYQMIYRFFSVDTAKILGKWIGFVGTRRVAGCDESAEVAVTDFDYVEEGFYAVERSLVDTNKWHVIQKAKLEQQLSAAKAQQEATVKQLNDAVQENTTHLEALAQEKAKGEQLSTELAEEKAKGEQLSTELAEEKAKGEQLSAELAEEKAKGEQLSTELAEGKAKGEQLNAELAALFDGLQRSTDELVLLQKNVKAQQQQISDAEKQLTAVNIQLRNTERKLSLAQYKYNLLAKSKLGRFTLWYWKRKDAVLFHFRKGDPSAKTIRNYAKKIPGLRPLVLWLRKMRRSENDVHKTVGMKDGLSVQTEHKLEKVQQEACVAAQNTIAKGDENFFERIKEKLQQIPESNGGRYYKKSDKVIGIICDQFYYDSVFAAADFKYISPSNWGEVLDAGIDVLLLVSTWNGLNKQEWSGFAYEGTKRRQLVYTIIEECKGKNIPVVFYSKEDPPHYQDYIELAKRCDYIFTTAEEVIKDYIRDCGHDRVYPLRFGINPEYHNPVGMRHFPKEKEVIFSGSWMAKFTERCDELSMIFNGVLAAGKSLKIIDRFYHLHDDERYRYPDKYFSYASPALEHDDLQKVHKLYDWAININSVKNSQTMFANRVYELQATGNLLLSNYSIGVNSLMPTVFMVHEQDEVQRILEGFSQEEIYERQIAGVRKVMTGETCYDRVSEMLDKIGLGHESINRKVLVVARELNDHVRKMFDWQTYENKTLVVEEEFNDELQKEYDIIAFFDGTDKYGPFYLEDMINGFKYTNSDYITKEAFVKHGALIEGREHEYTSVVGSKYRTVFWSNAFSADTLLTLDENVNVPNGYAIDHFGYEKEPKVQKKKNAFKFAVILPIYNNGWHLYGKSFASLRRSSMFNDIELILVDDGSTDEFTPKMLKYLEDLYPNVKTFEFGDGGSGSASRPRNQGIKMAESEYISYLDPDDEMIGDGYAVLYKKAIEGNHDLTLGNVLICGEKTTHQDYRQQLKKSWGSEHIKENQGELLLKTNFSAIRIQAMVIKKQLIRERGLSQVVGAIGEDTLFGWQLLQAAHSIYVMSDNVHVYYAATAGSIDNSIGVSFFKKYLPCEDVRLKWLQKEGLMDCYMSQRYNGYCRYWQLKNLARVKLTDAVECTKIVYQIMKMYEPWYNGKEPLINEFIKYCEIEKFADAFVLVRKTFFPE